MLSIYVYDSPYVEVAVLGNVLFGAAQGSGDRKGLNVVDGLGIKHGKVAAVLVAAHADVQMALAVALEQRAHLKVQAGARLEVLGLDRRPDVASVGVVEDRAGPLEPRLVQVVLQY